MLQSIRDKATGPLAWIIVGIISVPFAFFGIEAFRSGGGSDDAAKVNGEAITRYALQNRVESRYQQFQQMLGENFRPEMFDRSQLRSGVLDEMINEELTRQYLLEAGYRVSDSAVLEFIATQEAYQDAEGNFSPEIYRDNLARQGSSTQQYEARVRNYLSAAQFENSLRDTAIVTPQVLEAEWAHEQQTRDFQWRRYLLANFEAGIEVGAEEVAALYAERKDKLRTPERIQINYVELALADIAAKIETSEADIRAHYDANLSLYRAPEVREARHILMADEGEAVELRERLAAGELTFADAAKDFSEDPGSKASGGDLGRIARGEMVPPFEEAVFSLPKGELSEPVETQFGWHLIEVTAISGGEVKPFEVVREDISQKLSRQRAREQLDELRDELEQLSFENPGSLEVAATALDLEIKTSDWFTRSGGAGLTAEADVIRASFSDAVLNSAENSPLLGLGERFVVLRLATREAPRAQTLDEVSEQLAAELKRQKAEEAVQAALNEDREALSNGRAWTELPSREGVVGATEVDIKRNAYTPDRALVSSVFAQSATELPVVAEVKLEAGGDQALYQLQKVSDGDWEQASEDDKIALERRVRSQIAAAEMQAVIDDLRRRADIYLSSLSGDDEEG